MIVLTTNPITSMKRAFERDDLGNLITGLLNTDNAKDHIKWYVNNVTRLKNLSKNTDSKQTQDFIDLYKEVGVNNVRLNT